ncbi:DUF4345 family protein [Henriciella sp. AS95]|uniref:DUF4345 family protein n=1 Tax=Henriciella sp. AS95 TaxID=3135782 RepID=UPI00317E25D0
MRAPPTSTVMWTRLFLGLIALLFIAFGLWSLFDPLGMTAQLGVETSGPNNVFEMRGIYGGVSLGAAALTGMGALQPAKFERPALWFLAAYMGGYTLSRAVSLIAGDTPTATSWAFASFEVLTFILTCVALRSRSHEKSPA